MLAILISVHYAKKDGLNWVALRLADVIGPRDTTYRSKFSKCLVGIGKPQQKKFLH